MIDLLVLIACAVAALLGWRNGVLRTALPVGSVLAGYAAAVLLYRPLGDLIAARTPIPSLAAAVLGGVAALVVTVLVVRLAGRMLTRSVEAPRPLGEEDPRTPGTASRAAGALLGAAWALALALVLVWGVETVAALTGSRPEPRSTTGAWARSAVERLATTVAEERTGDPFTASALAAMVADPAEFSRMVSDLSASEPVRSLVTDPELRELVARGDVEALAERPELRSLLRDPAFLDAADRLGVIDLTEITDPDRLAAQLSGSLGPLVRAVERVRADPEAMESIREMDLGARLQRGEVMALVQSPEVRAVLGRVRAALESAKSGAGGGG